MATVEIDAPPQCQCAECQAEREAERIAAEAERQRLAAIADRCSFWCEYPGCRKIFTGSVREYTETTRVGKYYCCPNHRSS